MTTKQKDNEEAARLLVEIQERMEILASGHEARLVTIIVTFNDGSQHEQTVGSGRITCREDA